MDNFKYEWLDRKDEINSRESSNDQNELRNGTYITYHDYNSYTTFRDEEKKIFSIYNYKNNLCDGMCINYYRNGNKQLERNFTSGILNYSKDYSINGTLFKEIINIDDNKKHQKNYDKNGNILSEIIENGKKDITMIKYHTNGNVKYKSGMINGKIPKPIIAYDFFGNIVMRVLIFNEDINLRSYLKNKYNRKNYIISSKYRIELIFYKNKTILFY